MRKIAVVLLLIILGAGVLSVNAQENTCKGILWISKINLNACVETALLVDGQHQVPSTNVGYAEGTGWISDNKYNVVLIGHTPGVFSGLVYLGVGDTFELFDTNTTAVYRITSINVGLPTDVSPYQQPNTPVATLITCTEDNQRRIIQAERIKSSNQ